MTYKPADMKTPAMINDKLTGAFWKKGPTTDAVKIILIVSVKISAARFFCFSVSYNEKYGITLAAPQPNPAVAQQGTSSSVQKTKEPAKKQNRREIIVLMFVVRAARSKM